MLMCPDGEINDHGPSTTLQSDAFVSLIKPEPCPSLSPRAISESSDAREL